MLALAMFPCCTVDDCPDDKVKTEKSAHENDDADCGSCSPFFNCEGCAATSVTIETSSIEIISLTVKQVYTGFIPPIISQVKYEFWQPPRIG